MIKEITFSIKLDANIDLQYIEIKEYNLYFIERTIYINNEKFKYERGIIKSEQFNNIKTSINPVEFQYDIILLTKQNIEKYKKSFYGSKSFDEILESKIEQLKDIEDINNIIPVINDSYNGQLTDINGNYLEHSIKFNSNCYMVTSREYDIEKLLYYLEDREDITIFSRGDIPYYNLNKGEYGIEFINFYVQVPPEKYHLVDKNNIWEDLPKEIIDIERFKKNHYNNLIRFHK